MSITNHSLVDNNPWNPYTNKVHNKHMGRTYKRNDTYRSSRPKSLREKRQWSGKKRDIEFSTDDNISGENYNKRSQQFDINSQDYDN